MYTIDFNDDTFDPALARLEAALGDLTPVMQDLGELMVQSTQDRMVKGIDADGRPFAPRSPVTLDLYRQLERSFGAPLNVSGELRLSIAYEADSAGVRWGSNAIQAAVMQFGASQGAFGTTQRGGPIPWGNIPPRPYIGVSEEDRTNIVATIEEYLQDAADGD